MEGMEATQRTEPTKETWDAVFHDLGLGLELDEVETWSTEKAFMYVIVVTIQFYVFNELFEGNPIEGRVVKVTKDKSNSLFQGNENDYLETAQLTKDLHPLLNKLKEVLVSRMSIDEFMELNTFYINSYLNNCCVSQT